jgi:hypothetical protein
MSRKLMAVFLSSALAFGSVSTSAWSASNAPGSQAQSVQTVDPARNQPPLPPAGAASIEQAQGFIRNYPLLTIAIVAGVVALVWILVDDDDDSSTGT